MKKILLVLALGLALAPCAAGAEDASQYYVPPTQFNALLEVMDLGFDTMFGLFRNATGNFTYDVKAKSISGLRFALDANSIVAANADDGAALAALLASPQYPEIDFAASGDARFVHGKAYIKGILTVHGTQKPFTFTATLNRVGQSPAAGDMWNSEGTAVGLSLEGVFKRADFGMGDDPLIKSRFGDAITLRIEMQGIRQ
ncbi:MAG TPA: YceI family protein [Alphaproteobacteria bacterium]|nr:YceI family protein [Alphaproteobacteria bacterium]